MVNKAGSGPLSGIRVLDLGTMIAGPVAATFLADFGAEVIKVEQPGGGDTIRSNGPSVAGEGLWWNVEGRSKKSLTLDLRVPEGQEVLRGLVARSDVLIENFRPGTMAKWKIGYDALQGVNPKLVMLSISGYGQTGPYAARAAYDRIALAFAGFLNLTGNPDGPPLRPGVAVADYQSAMLGAFAVMMTLYHRDVHDGPGQQIDLSLYETVLRSTDVLITAYDKLGVSRVRAGNLHFAAAPGDHFETIDGRYLVLTVSSNGMFARLCTAMGKPELKDEPRFSSHQARWENIVELNSLVGVWIKSHPVSAICTELDTHGMAYSLVYTPADMVADPHYSARESISVVDNPRIGELRMPAPHPKLSATPAPAIRAAPSLGQDTDGLLGDLLGLSREQIEELRQRGVI